MNSSASRITLIAVLFLCPLFAFLFFSHSAKPERFDPEKLSLAFWSWRSENPSAAEVREAVFATGARLLFLRAGQLDADGDALKRIRSPRGRFPEGIEIHLVYNATRGLLRRLESLPPEQIGSALAASFQDDVGRARADGAMVGGLQIDFDYPTRLLPEYAALLRSLKKQLPPDVQVSITGLPTWAENDHLHEVLDQVDFWIPQLYGAEIPEHISDPRPISSSTDVSRALTRIKGIGKPYFAGLSAYGYALLFDRHGSIVEVRGDIDRSRVDRDASFVHDSMHRFRGDSGEIRSVYRAVRQVVLDGSAIEEGEYLVFDAPTAASLRANARAVRRNADENLLGICVFRLPTGSDITNLRLAEAATALFDREEEFRSNVFAKRNPDGTVAIGAINTGTGSVMHGEGQLAIDVTIEGAGASDPRSIKGFSEHRTMCAATAGQLAQCGPKRAALIRLVAPTWRPGDEAAANFQIAGAFVVRLTVMKNGTVVETGEKTFSNTGEE